MTNNNLILKYCPNYNKIVTFNFMDNDYISEKLVSFYKNFILSINLNDIDDLNKAMNIDKIVNKYINDYVFRKEMKKELLQIKVKKSVDNVLKIIIENIIKIFERYEASATRKIYISRWI